MLEIFSNGNWSAFTMSDFTDAVKVKEFKSISPFAMVLKASGQELDFIKSQFVNIPITTNGVCAWRNPFCEFILSNLTSEI